MLTNAYNNNSTSGFAIPFNEMERLRRIHSRVIAELSTRFNSPEAEALQQSTALSGNNKVHVCITTVSALIYAHQSSEFKTLHSELISLLNLKALHKGYFMIILCDKRKGEFHLEL